MNNLLDIKKIKKNYITDKEEIEAIKDISFSVKKGEIITLVGSIIPTEIALRKNFDKNGMEITYGKQRS